MIDALLLLGPTGAGKSPLGDHLAKNGFNGKKCHHFDFGKNLRRAHKGKIKAGLTAQEVDFIGRVLTEGALLEDDTFYLAEKLLTAFLKRSGAGSGDLLVLNGLPRHEGQAKALEKTVCVKEVISLQCSAQTVHERISLNAGGDRAARSDDSVELIERKLAVYEKRTQPLLSYYFLKGVTIHTTGIFTGTTPEDIIRLMK